MAKHKKGGFSGGAEGDRTPDLVIANDALSQLSYGPEPRADVGYRGGLVKITAGAEHLVDRMPATLR